MVCNFNLLVKWPEIDLLNVCVFYPTALKGKSKGFNFGNILFNLGAITTN